jgi:thiamine-monophosphate kinase
MMDCSDGLATDLGHICRESGVGARVDIDRVPVAAAAATTARALGRDAVSWATAGGEDYELLLTCEAGRAEALARELRRATGTALTVIGEAVADGPQVVWVGGDGRPVTLTAGYEHFRG